VLAVTLLEGVHGELLTYVLDDCLVFLEHRFGRGTWSLSEEAAAVIGLLDAEMPSPEQVLPAVLGTEDCLTPTRAVGGIVYTLHGLKSALKGDFTIHGELEHLRGWSGVLPVDPPDRVRGSSGYM
jgi:hypothetical protein